MGFWGKLTKVLKVATVIVELVKPKPKPPPPKADDAGADRP